MIPGNIWHQLKPWIIIDFFRANSSDLEWFECQFQKLTYGAFFPLNFHHWVGIFDKKWLSVKNVEFENSPWYWPSKKVVNFQILHFWLKVIFDQKFQLSDENWVGKMPNIVILGDRTQIIPNWTKLREKNR